MSFRNGRHACEVRVRYAETDRMGIAYNGHYLTWFEIGRTEFLRECGLAYREMESQGFMLPVVEAEVKYLKPACYDEVLVIRTSIGRKPGARIHLEYEILRDGEVLATGFTEHAFTDAGLRPVRPSRALIESLRTLWEQSHHSDGAPA